MTQVAPRTLPWDWYPGVIPENVLIDDSAFVETTYSFDLYRSEREVGVEIGRAASIYLGTMFDVGKNGRVSVGQFSLVNGARIVCESEIEIGDYALISWNVVLMDTYRLPLEPSARRREVQRAAQATPRRFDGTRAEARPIRIGQNVWIGFDSCVLPGVTIGEGSIVGAKSVVAADVPPFTVVAGNPARVIRQLEPCEAPPYE